jgi:hypothetical protein
MGVVILMLITSWRDHVCGERQAASGKAWGMTHAKVGCALHIYQIATA